MRMKRSAVLTVAVAIAAFADSSGAQQCALDLNGDKRTGVDELVTAIGEALNGCPGGATSTPTRTPTPPAVEQCPFDFNDDNFLEPFCTYTGTLSTTCYGSEASLGGWSSNGSTVISVLTNTNSTSIAWIAVKTGARSARIQGIAFGPDFDTEYPATGSLSLPSATRFTGSSDSGVSCTDLSFAGTFFAILGGTAATEPDTVAGGVASAYGARTPEPQDIEGILRRLWERRRR